MKNLVLVFAVMFSSSAWSLDIVEALNRGQRVEFERCTEVNSDAAEVKVLRASFDKVLQAAGVKNVTLRIAECRSLVQVLGGEVIVHPALASWDEGERLFALAHELGHILNRDWTTFTGAFRQAIPLDLPEGQVNEELRKMSPMVRELMYGFEYSADEYALKLLDAMGRNSLADGAACIRRVPALAGSPTHPGSAQRIAKLNHVHLEH